MQQKKTNNKIVNKIKLVDGITRPVRNAVPLNNYSFADGRSKTLLSSDVEYRTDGKKNVLYSGLKMAGVLLVTVVLSASLSSIGSTVSYFSDIETSLANLLHAGSLDFSVALDDSDSPDIKLTAGAQSVTIVPTVTPGLGDLPLVYKVSVEQTGGNSPALCNAVDVFASSTPFVFSGKLMALLQGTTTVIAPLSLSLSLPPGPGFPITDTCIVDIVYSGWVLGQTEGIEYHDVERVTLFIKDPPAMEASTTESVLPVVEPEVKTDEASTTPEATSLLPDLGGGGGGGGESIPPTEQSADTSASDSQASTSTDTVVDTPIPEPTPLSVSETPPIEIVVTEPLPEPPPPVVEPSPEPVLEPTLTPEPPPVVDPLPPPPPTPEPAT